MKSIFSRSMEKAAEVEEFNIGVLSDGVEFEAFRKGKQMRSLASRANGLMINVTAWN